MRAMRKSKGFAIESKAVLTHSTPKLFPLASELECPLPNCLADRLVGGDGVEPFGLRLVVVSQEVNQTQRLTLCSQLRCPRPSIPHLHRPRGRRSGLTGAFGLTVGISGTGTFFAGLNTVSFSIFANAASA